MWSGAFSFVILHHMPTTPFYIQGDTGEVAHMMCDRTLATWDSPTAAAAATFRESILPY